MEASERAAAPSTGAERVGLRNRAGHDGDAPRTCRERTVAVWHPAMSEATYGRLLRLLFGPAPDDDGGGPASGEAA